MPRGTPLNRRRLGGALLGLGFAGLALAVPASAAEDEAAWADLKPTLFGGRAIADGAGVIALEAPKRAFDAALVPVTVRAELPQAEGRYIKTLHLIVDDNPAPVAAVVHFTPDNGLAGLATRLRVNEYTHVRAVAETSDGALYMARSYVKAAGGCSAPATKDRDKATARLGQMRLRSLTKAPVPGTPAEAQLMISHPNNSGMQIDQLTRNWIPAHYVQKVTVSYGGRELMAIDGDIALSEDPNFRFHFLPRAEPAEMRVEVVDSKGERFEKGVEIAPRPAS